MIHPAIEQAWQFTWERFFCKKTNLFYDYLVGEGADAATGHLPEPWLIGLQVPGACGHGTGMEDSMLSAGSMLDAIVARYEALGEEEMQDLAAAVFDGMRRCAEVSSSDGFLPRSVSPVDGVSHYMDSSRDQYTHWVYGAWRLYHSALSTEEQREQIRKGLSGFARRAEKNVTEANGWHMLREDSGITLVTKMWGTLGKHEYLRLPMIYAAAWRTTGDNHWKEQYEAYRDEALRRMSGFARSDWGRSYAGLQLQYSARLLYDADPDCRAEYLSIMHRVSDISMEEGIREAQRICSDQYDRQLMYYQYQPWDLVRAIFNGVIGGRVYYNPAQSELAENAGFYHVRSVGEAAAIQALVPDRKAGEEHLKSIEQVAGIIEYDRMKHYAPMLLACGYFLLLENRKKTGG